MGPLTLHHLSITLHQEALPAALCGAVVEACEAWIVGDHWSISALFPVSSKKARKIQLRDK